MDLINKNWKFECAIWYLLAHVTLGLHKDHTNIADKIVFFQNDSFKKVSYISQIIGAISYKIFFTS